MIYTNLTETLQIAIKNALANTHTALIAKVITVNKTTIDCKPVINRVVNNQSIELPLFKEVPIIHLQGGNNYIAMPIKVGDYVELIVNERSFDQWYAGNDNTAPIFDRMHDYSDSFVLGVINNKNNEIPIPTKDITIQGNVIHNGNLSINGDLKVTGNIEVSQNITSTAGDIKAGNVSLRLHIHGGVEPGSGSTRIPT